MDKIPYFSVRKRKPKKSLPARLRGYGWQWARAARDYRQAHPICEHCKSHVAEEVDHRIPIKQGGAILDQANMQALCRPCHQIKTNEDQERYRA